MWPLILVIAAPADHPRASRHPSSYEEGKNQSTFAPPRLVRAGEKSVELRATPPRTSRGKISRASHRPFKERKFALVSMSPPHRGGVPPKAAGWCSLVELGTRGLNDLAHLCDIGFDLRRELLGRVRDGLDSIFVQALEEIRPPDDRDRVVVNLLHYVTRHACRGHKAVPGLDVETGKRFGDRGHVGQRLCPFGAGDADRLPLPALRHL